MPYTTNHPDTLLVDGTDLQSLDGISVTDFSGLFAPGARRGSNDVIPGRDGEVGVAKPLAAYSFTVPIIVDGADNKDPLIRRALLVANLRAAMGVIWGGSNGGLVALSRRLGKVGGGYDTHTCNGQFVTLNSFALLNFDTGRTDLEFVNLDGAWSSGSGWVVP